MNYQKIYPHSWKTVSSNLYLLFFGLFASILGFHEIKTIFNLTDTSPDFIGETLMSWAEIVLIFATNQLNWSQLPDLMAVFGLFVILSIGVVMAVSSQGALIHASKSTNKGKFMEHLQAGVEKFWPLLGLSVINTLIGYFFLVLVIVPIIKFVSLSNEYFLFLLLSIVAFFVLLPLVIIISFVTRYSSAYVVLKNQSLPNAFTKSWILFKENWVVTVENAFLLTLITGLYFLILLSAIVFVFTPFLILSILMYVNSFFFTMIVAIGGTISVLVLLAGVAYYGAFYNLVWANIWHQLIAKGKSHSKVHKMAHKHLPGLTK